MAKKSSTVGKTVRPKKIARKKISTTIQPTELLTRARELAWIGQHAKAIELASQALAYSKIKPTEQMDLLDLRAESYIAQGKLDLAAKDVDTMIKLANAERIPPLKAQALSKKAYVQINKGDLKAALKTATFSLEAARLSKQKLFIAESLLLLSEAQFRVNANELAIQSAQQAVDLFHAFDHLSGEGRSYWCIAAAYNNLARAEESRAAAYTALTICRRAGDQYGIGNANNQVSLNQTDLWLCIQHLQEALAAFEMGGYEERSATVIHNLGVRYQELGLYHHAHRLYRESMEIHRSMGARLHLANNLAGMFSTEIIFGDFDSATERLNEISELIPRIGDTSQESSLPAYLGNLALAQNKPKIAIRHYKTAVKIARQSKLREQNIFLTQLGKAHLEKGEAAAALKATSKATAMHRAQSFARPDDFTSQEIWLRHAQALNATRKTNGAYEALECAYDFLMESIQNIRDMGLRRNYLNKVEANREIIHLWVKGGVKRTRSKDRLFAHLNIESNLREPFKRLAETSLRLNTLKTVAEIQTFLVEEVTELSGGEHVLLIREKDGQLEVADSLLPRGEDTQKVLASINKQLNHALLTRTAQLFPQPNPSPHEALPKGAGRGIKGEGISRIIAPLIAQNQVLGYLYVDMDSLYGTFDETDRDMLGMLANQGAVALDNTGLLEGMEKKIEERTEELNGRVDELAILNSVGEAMAKTLDVKTVTRIVGDKVRDIFHAEAVSIMLLNAQTNLIHKHYEYDKGEGGYVEYQQPFPFGIG